MLALWASGRDYGLGHPAGFMQYDHMASWLQTCRVHAVRSYGFLAADLQDSCSTIIWLPGCRPAALNSGTCPPPASRRKGSQAAHLSPSVWDMTPARTAPSQPERIWTGSMCPRHERAASRIGSRGWWIQRAGGIRRPEGNPPRGIRSRPGENPQRGIRHGIRHGVPHGVQHWLLQAWRRSATGQMSRG